MKCNRVAVGLGGGSLLQIANRSHVQMMSYLVETPRGDVVMIDGGNPCEEDGAYLYEMLKKRGGHVALWIITHAHEDHFGALLWMLENGKLPALDIKRLVFSFPPTEWFKTVEGGGSYEWVMRFQEQLSAHGICPEPMVRDSVIELGGMSFEVLNDCADYEQYTTVNDTTIVVRAHFPQRDVLFLGDLGEAGGKNLLSHCSAERLRCDIVQMAHHGQNGVNRDFYSVVRPRLCLYTAPDWLWENDAGGGRNSGPWKTLETRRWMEELGAEQSFSHAGGDWYFY